MFDLIEEFLQAIFGFLFRLIGWAMVIGAVVTACVLFPPFLLVPLFFAGAWLVNR